MSMHNRVYDHAARRLRARQADGSGGVTSAGQSATQETTSSSPTSAGDYRVLPDIRIMLSSSSAPEQPTSSTQPTTTSETSTPPSTTTPPTTSSPPPTTTTPSTTSTPSPQTTTSSTSASPQTASTTPRTTPATTSSSTSTTSSSPSSVSSSSSSSTTAPAAQATPSTTLSVNGNLAGTFTASNNDAGNNLLTTTNAGGAAPTTTESSAPATSGGIKGGAIAGGVLGGIVGIAIIAALIAMIIRRKRSRDSTDQFDAAQFRRSAMIMEDPPSASHSPTQLSPPPRLGVFPGRDQVVSVASTATGPGMAGQGAYAFQAQANGGGGGVGDYNDYNQYMHYLDGPNAAYQDEPAGKNSAEYYTDSFSQQIQPTGQPGLASRQPIQQRQQYTFGETFGNVVSDDGHSDPGDAYGSHMQMQAQGSYNPEAYSHYYNNAGAGAIGQAYSPAQDPNVRPRPGASGSGGDNRTPSMMGEDAYGGI
ncbi:hypothetical protein AAF712_012873 [Marasmius tenuissimus]|uniref:Uncharacterized protein n=1 Tax=Marasmius tenuissimus TaxID=585030 RepID=A0ABR2ZGK9_9AGAR